MKSGKLLFFVVGCAVSACVSKQESSSSTTEPVAADSLATVTDTSVRVATAPPAVPGNVHQVGLDTIQGLSAKGMGFRLVPLQAADFESGYQIRQQPLLTKPNVKEFEQEGDGEFSATTTYAGTLPRSGIHVYRRSGYEESQHLLMHRESFEVLGTQALEYSDQPIETPDGQFVFQNQYSMASPYGVMIYRLKGTELDDEVRFNEIRLVELRVNAANQIAVKVEQLKDGAVEGYYLLQTFELPKTGSLTDARDGKTYKTVRINTTWWMNQTLDFDTDSLDYVDQQNPERPRFYQLNASGAYQKVLAERLCPEGWHLPSLSEWYDLFSALGVPEVKNGDEPIWVQNIQSQGFSFPPTGMVSWQGGAVTKENTELRTDGMNYSYYWIPWGNSVACLRFDTNHCGGSLCGQVFFNLIQNTSPAEGFCVRCVREVD